MSADNGSMARTWRREGLKGAARSREKDIQFIFHVPLGGGHQYIYITEEEKEEEQQGEGEEEVEVLVIQVFRWYRWRCADQEGPGLFSQ